MKIKNITLENFRCFKKRIEIPLNEELNIILGSNNVGKSTIFIALQKLVLFGLKNTNSYRGSDKNKTFLKSDWSYENIDEELNIEVEISISDTEKENILDEIQFENTVKKELRTEFKRDFKNELKIIFRNKFSSNMIKPIIYFSNYYFFLDEFSKKIDFDNTEEYSVKNFKEICNEAISEDKMIASKAEEFLVSNKRAKIKLTNTNLYDSFLKLLFDNFKIFEDIRQKPRTDDIVITECFDGKETAATLLNLYNGNKIERSKFEMIQKEFTKYFPLISMAVRKKNNEVNIMITSEYNKEFEHPLDQAGTGIMEFIIILTNLIGKEKHFFVLEEPELHLHPSAQKALFSLIKEHSKKNQIAIITHSTYFVDLVDISNNILIKKENNSNSIFVGKINKENLSDLNLRKILKELQNKNREMFFAKRVILVEGDTEYSTLSILAEKKGKNLDLLDILVCSVCGKDSIKIYQQILDVIRADYYILCDKDNEELPEHIAKHSQKYVFDPEFEEVFKKNGLTYLFDEAKKELKLKEGKNKPIIGKYVAEKISRDKIPEGISKFLDEVTKFE